MTRPTPVAALRIARLDPRDARDAAALVDLLDQYARDPTGGGTALAEDAKARLPAVLAARPHYVGWLAFDADRPVGLVNAFEGVSTFKARPLLNIHDIAVAATHRGRGVGRALLAAVEAEGRARGCCKLTLEALEGNLGAIGLYRDVGFVAYELDPAMGRATFFEKWLT
ncbi:MAG: GNAT family N-acetyltransferase [Burkholderiales bacterium]